MSEEKNDPPPVYAQWVRADAPDATDERVARLWRAASEGDRKFWADLVGSFARFERIMTAWTRGMYAARIDCTRGDVKAAIECLSEGLDGYDGTEWDGTETGTEWWERTKAEEGL